MTQYVALLRGINLAGKRSVKMEELRKVFESLGCTKVKTILASGNVLFESTEKDQQVLRTKIQEKLKQKFGFEIPAILRKINDIEQLIHSNPFQKIKVTPETRLYVTFLSESSKSTLKIPYESPDKDFKILRVSNTEVCSVVTLSPKRGTVDAMAILEKEFGRNVTTRNWNTVLKLLKP